MYAPTSSKRNPLYLLTLEIQRSFIDIVNVYKKRFDPPAFRRIEAHVTLFPPFFLPGEERLLAQDVRTFVDETAPFKLRTSGLGTFGNKVLYVGFRESREAQAVYNKTKDLFLEKHNVGIRRVRAHFVPHVTIIQRGTRSVIEEARAAMKDVSFPHEVRAESVALFAKEPNRWVWVRGFPFGG